MVVQDATRANFKPRDRPGGRHAYGGRGGSGRRPPPRGDRAVRPVQREGRPVGARPHRRESRRSQWWPPGSRRRPSREGKTTTSVGLAQGMGGVGARAMLSLREPSMGPVFGDKGWGTGGGRAQVGALGEIN